MLQSDGIERSGFGRALSRLRLLIPEGHPLPDRVWQRRHRGIVILLWLHAVGIFAFALFKHFSLAHAILEGGIVGAAAALASLPVSRKFQAAMAAFGLTSASAVLVHLSGGYIEFHFHFFVMVGVMALYQDWVPFLLAVAFVALHHGVVGVLAPNSVYNHASAWAHPWYWAGLHALFIAAMSVVSLISWRLNEATYAYGQLVLNAAGEGIVGVHEDGQVMFVNEASLAMTGWEEQSVIGRPVSELLFGPAAGSPAGRTWPLAASADYRDTIETVFSRKDGSTFPVEYVSTPIVRRVAHVGTVGVFKDISDRQRAAEALRETTQTLRAVVEASPLGIYVFDVAGKVRLWNPAAERIFGWTAAEVLGRTLPTIPEEGEERFRELQARVLRGEELAGLEVRRRRKDGSPIDVSLSTAALRDTGGKIVAVMTMLADVTERRQWEHQLRQSQKMEAIGRLAGGVAHDFNNLLTVISGRSHLALERLAPDHRAHDDVDLIARTADRASRLTRQLLAFSRKQILELRVLDLNSVLAGMESLIRPLIGESIEIEMVLDRTLGRAEVDPGQLEQVVLNLAVNARDAMPLGGRLTIETANAELDAGYARQHAEVHPGHYGMLAVSDTGTGMDAETRSRVFEPFFTTKGVGEGTGLGLATIYGIVKQSGGHIALYSEVGHGTSFKIYLPRVETPATPTAVTPAPSVPPSRRETVFIVAAAKDLRALAREILEEEGYTVLTAAAPSEPLESTSRPPGPTHLLLTDVVMPQMGGRELAGRLTAVRPNMRVLYMSGYTDDSVVRHGVLEREVAFLQKPFTVRGLSQKVREVLEHEGATLSV